MQGVADNLAGEVAAVEVVDNPVVGAAGGPAGEAADNPAEEAADNLVEEAAGSPVEEVADSFVLGAAVADMDVVKELADILAAGILELLVGHHMLMWDSHRQVEVLVQALDIRC